MVVRLNLLLGIFNLLPIPPLDGSKVFAMLLPEKEANAYLSIGTIGIFILFFLLLATDFGGFIFNLLEVAENALIP
jgi:Zn-dependent protease